MGANRRTTRDGGFSLIEGGANPNDTKGKLGTFRVTHSPGLWYVERLEPNIGYPGRSWRGIHAFSTRDEVEHFFARCTYKPRIRIRAGVGSAA